MENLLNSIKLIPNTIHSLSLNLQASNLGTNLDNMYYLEDILKYFPKL